MTDIREIMARGIEPALADFDFSLSYAYGSRAGNAVAKVSRALTAAREAGYVLVPVEPTEAMVMAGCGAIEDADNRPAANGSFWGADWTAEANACWPAMIAAGEVKP